MRDFIEDLGLLALGSRLRRVSDRIMSSGIAIYRGAEVDFEPRWFPLFRLLLERGPSSVGDCAKALGLTHAAVSQTARKMVQRELIEASRDADDERRRVLALSDAGRTLAPKLTGVWADIEAALEDAVEYGGVDILAAVEGLESALAVQSLSERVAAKQRARVLDTVEIVDFETEDAEHFERLNREWLEKHFTVEPVDDELFANPEVIVDAGGAILFAKVGDEFVGTCALQLSDDGCELTKMAVTEAWQGRRIGAKLLESAISRARTLGFSAVHLITNSSLVPAINLYRKFGFRVTHSGTHKKYERGDLVMELSL